MMRRVLATLAAGVAVLASGAAPARAVSGGSPVTDGSSPFVAKVNVGEARTCTGALVGPQWIITATSCFAVDGGPVTSGVPALPTTVTVGRADLSGSAGRVLPVVRILPHRTRDVVLAQLALRVPDIAPIAVSATAPAAGDTLRSAGYGRTATEWVPDRLHATPAVVGAVAAESFGWTGPAGSAVSACLGDGGGPVFRTGGSQPELVGLNVAAGQSGCLDGPDTGHGVTAVRVDDLGSWVTATARATEPTTRYWPHLSSSTGIGGYDLAETRDQVVPFDFDHSGKLDHLVVYRPGAGIVHIVKRNVDGAYTSILESTTGIGGFDLLGATDRIMAFDYDHSGKQDHLVLYRPGSSVVFVLKHGAGNTFTPVYSSTTAGIGNYPLEDPRDQLLAFDYEHSGKPDHLLVYRPETGWVTIIKHGAGNSFSKVFASTTGIGGYDLLGAADRIVAFDHDHSGKLDHLVLYRPGSGIVFVLKHGAGNTFTPVYSSTTGIGGYSLAETRDQLLAYDYEYSGRLDHLVLYRPGAGIIHILKHGTGNSFSPAFISLSGIGGYDLLGAEDRIVAFDARHSGGQNELLLYRPGSRIAWTVDRYGALPLYVAVTVQPAIGPDSIVENLTYPGAAQILAEHGLKVFRGDGRIVFVTSRTFEEGQCETGQIQVEKQLDVAPYGVYYCFRTVGTQGFLTLEVPGTFGVRGGDKPIVATAELPSGEQEYAVPAGGFVAIDPGSGSELPQAVLVELRLGT